MNAIVRFWQNFARYVKRGHAPPLPVLEPMPTSWADHKRAYDRAQKTHHGRGETGANLRKAAYESLKRDVLNRLDKEEASARILIETHPLFFSRNRDAFEAAIRWIARRRIEEAQR